MRLSPPPSKRENPANLWTSWDNLPPKIIGADGQRPYRRSEFFWSNLVDGWLRQNHGARSSQAINPPAEWLERATSDFSHVSFVIADTRNRVENAESIPAEEERRVILTLNSRITFEGSTFPGMARFRNAVFLRSISFQEAEFRGSAKFHNVQFFGEASFEKSTFFGHVAFRDASFRKEAQFENSSFLRDITFRGANFHQGAWFQSTTYPRDCAFSRRELFAQCFFRQSHLLRPRSI